MHQNHGYRTIQWKTPQLMLLLDSIIRWLHETLIT
jgi:hypothetical protein